MILRAILAIPAIACLLQSQTNEPVFRATRTVQLLPVQVVDSRGVDVDGIASADFTIFENSRPQPVVFFGAGRVPVEITFLLDTSRSMAYDGKLQRARALLAPLLLGRRPDDVIFFAPFTDRVESFEQIVPDKQALPAIETGSAGSGTAIYDALASSICRMRAGKNVLQAIVLITDGADQHSRLTFAQVMKLVQSAGTQIFTIGLFANSEYSIFNEREKTVTLLGEREIDNPLLVMESLARESGGQAFFPRSDHDLRRAIERIAAVLRAQYVLAYYPPDVSRPRRIEVKVRGEGLHVFARRMVAAVDSGASVHFDASSCQISPEDHPYPWGTRISRTPSGSAIYREDFSDPSTGWPTSHKHDPDGNARSTGPLFQRPGVRGMMSSEPASYSAANDRPGFRYVAGGYELTRNTSAGGGSGTRGGVVVAYGPAWRDFRASVRIEADWGQTRDAWFATVAGLVFDLSESGYYAVVLSGAGEKNNPEFQFKVIRKILPGETVSELVPWTVIRATQTMQMQIRSQIARRPRIQARQLAIERAKGRIAVTVDGQPVGSFVTGAEESDPGIIGFTLFGQGRAVFRDLVVEGPL